jgi:hypothetical protein
LGSFFVLSVFLLLGGTDINTFGDGWSFWELIRSVFLVHGWGFPSWRLSTELIAYALFAAIAAEIGWPKAIQQSTQEGG